MSVLNITKNNFQEEVMNSNKPGSAGLFGQDGADPAGCSPR